ncbi:hypothetical protein [Burkholderia arboris]|uniref:hypothetical protein n=1 Tax=Burkholderia arboris TaxID=488730 RepID=UPI001CA3D524|nr:hypothetical protein [Burkholderia arboris]MBY8604372.1 hypothetical protein [Burkholderia arboris]MCA8049553.1 hypothetical protein [Burkholderia arboris]
MTFLNCTGATGRINKLKGVFFPLARAQFAPQQANYGTGHPFGACWAWGLIGPDKFPDKGQMPGGYPWSGVAPNPASAWPPHPFADDIYRFGKPPVLSEDRWIRGHLINQGWGGDTVWRNLTPLTKLANANHETVESFIGRFLDASFGWDERGSVEAARYWYGVLYWVQCAAQPLSAAPKPTDLYAYAPNFIKLRWRAVRLQKPDSRGTEALVRQQAAQAVANGTLEYLQNRRDIPFDFGTSPVAGKSTLPTGSEYRPGGALQGTTAGPPYFQVAPSRNDFDGDIEIHIPV